MSGRNAAQARADASAPGEPAGTSDHASPASRPRCRDDELLAPRRRETRRLESAGQLGHVADRSGTAEAQLVEPEHVVVPDLIGLALTVHQSPSADGRLRRDGVGLHV